MIKHKDSHVDHGHADRIARAQGYKSAADRAEQGKVC